jgi:hypothetical protein
MTLKSNLFLSNLGGRMLTLEQSDRMSRILETETLNQHLVKKLNE